MFCVSPHSHVYTNPNFVVENHMDRRKVTFKNGGLDQIYVRRTVYGVQSL